MMHVKQPDDEFFIQFAPDIMNPEIKENVIVWFGLLQDCLAFGNIRVEQRKLIPEVR